MRGSLTIVLALAVLGAVAILAPVQPLYASSGSMAPAIEPGALYFVIEGAPARTDDVITFESPEHDRLVTHRVIGETAAGFVTKGDANPSTDQAAGHPPVSRQAVVGRVLAVNGRPVTVPVAGSALAWLADARLPVLGLAAAVIAGSVAWSRREAHRAVPRRDVVYVSDVLTPLFVGCLVVSLLFVFWGASAHELTYVATAGEVTNPGTVPVDEAVTRSVDVETYTLPFTTVLVEADGVAVLDRTRTPTGLELLVEVPPKGATGVHRASIDVSTYPSTLPRGAIETLHGVHWLAAALGTIAPVLLPVYVLYLALVDGRTPIRWRTSRWLRRVGGS